MSEVMVSMIFILRHAKKQMVSIFRPSMVPEMASYAIAS